MIKTTQYKAVERTAVTARLTAPSGVITVLEGFSRQKIAFTYSEEGFETVEKNGNAESVIRFFPNETGIYTLEYSGITEQIEVVEDPNNHGFVKVSDADKRYFAYTDGTSYVPIGINLAHLRSVGKSSGKEFGMSGEYCWLGMRQYERWFKACAANGVNMVRIWLGQEYLCPDTEEAGVLDPIQLEKIDYLVTLAEAYGLRLKLTIEQFRYCNYEREAKSDSYDDRVFRIFNKRLYKNGRRCESLQEWSTDPLWQEMWLVKMRELAKRLSGNPTVFAIEFWNEVNLKDWCMLMEPKVRALFPKHLIISSLGSYDGAYGENIYANFCWDVFDFKQMHRYLDLGAEHAACKGSMIDNLRDGISILKEDGKPFLVAETGAVNECHSGPFRFYSADHRGILFCDAVYTPLFCGCAGCGNIWHWDSQYVESKNLYGYFRPLAQLCRGVDFDREAFVTDCYEDDEVIALLLRGKHHMLGYLRNKADNWKTVLRDDAEGAVVAEKTIPLLGYDTLETIPIWSQETARTVFADASLQITDLKYGMLLKFSN